MLKRKTTEGTMEGTVNTTSWANLPHLVIYKIFLMLNDADRRNASSVCKNWRGNYFRRRWWHYRLFPIKDDSLEKLRFLIDTFAELVTRAEVHMHSFSDECVQEFIRLLETMSTNHNLNSIVISTPHCDCCIKQTDNIRFKPADRTKIKNLLESYLPRMKKFGMSGIDAPLSPEDIVRKTDSSVASELGLATFRDRRISTSDPSFEPTLLKPFTELKVLTIDQEQMSKEFLASLDSATKMEFIMVYIHTLEKHPASLDEAWIRFRRKHPKCCIVFFVVHPWKEIESFHKTIMESGCPVPKGINSVIAKKRMDMEKAESCWKTGDDDGFSNLPYVVLTEIFNKLDSTDRLNASAVCKNWRQHLFHPRYWSTVQFPITRKHLKKTRFFTQAFGNIVSNATVIMNSSSKDCLRELCILLQTFAKNNNLKSLMIKPITHGFERPSKKNNSSCGSFLEKEIAKQLNKCLPKLEKFCLGCVGDLPLCLDNILENLNPSLLTALGVATTNLPVRYHCGCFDPRLLIRLSKLQELSIDSKQLTYRLLENLEHVKTLTKIIVYVHKHHELVFLYQPLMSFKEKHPVLTVKIRWRRVQEDW